MLAERVLMNFRGSASRKAPANRFDCRQRSQIKLHFFRSLLADKKNKECWSHRKFERYFRVLRGVVEVTLVSGKN